MSGVHSFDVPIVVITNSLSCLSILFFFKQKTAYEMRISDWSSDVCSSDLGLNASAETNAVAPSAAEPSRADLVALIADAAVDARAEIGRASCRARVCQYV